MGIGASMVSHLYSCWISRKSCEISVAPEALLVMMTAPYPLRQCAISALRNPNVLPLCAKYQPSPCFESSEVALQTSCIVIDWGRGERIHFVQSEIPEGASGRRT